jgi:DNA recombination protein RmuC
VQKIVDEGTNLYDKFVGFVRDLEKLGAQLNTVQRTYDDTWNKLKSGRGNLVKRADNLRKLGITPSKQLDENLVEEAREEIE